MDASISKPLIRKDQSLQVLLQSASSDELAAIVDIIAAQQEDRLLHDGEARQKILDYQQQGKLHDAVDIIAKEICAFGSNTIASVLRRGAPVEYRELVLDVARELKAVIPKKAAIADAEESILVALLANVLEGSSEQEIQELLHAGTIDAGILESIQRNEGTFALATWLSSRLDQLQLTRLLGDRIGLVSSGAAAAAFIGSRAVPAIALAGMGIAALQRSRPSLAVIVPVVVRIAFIRQRLITADYDKFFRELKACL